ncbi:MAG: ice-binding family protein [Acidimicrobiales bacterium]
MNVFDRRARAPFFLAVTAAAALAAPWTSASAAIVPTVPLGTSADYAVLGASTVTNTGNSVLNASLGLWPGTSITGFPPGIVNPPGTIDTTNAAAQQAQSDLTLAYVNAANRPVDATEPADLVNLHLSPGVYSGPSKGALLLSGPLVLDGGGDLDAVFIFQTDSTLITASSSNVTLINGAQECNVFWQIGSSATLGTNSIFRGNILALSSITVTTGVTVHGRALARNAAVTLDTDVFTSPTCAQTAGTTTTTVASGTAPTVAPGTPTTQPGATGTPGVPRVRLPDTGAPVRAPVLLAISLLALGTAAVRFGRRATATQR